MSSSAPTCSPNEEAPRKHRRKSHSTAPSTSGKQTSACTPTTADETSAGSKGSQPPSSPRPSYTSPGPEDDEQSEGGEGGDDHDSGNGGRLRRPRRCTQQRVSAAALESPQARQHPKIASLEAHIEKLEGRLKVRKGLSLHVCQLMHG